MDYLFTLKEIAKVSNKAIAQMAGLARNYKKEKNEELSVLEIDFEQCPSDCPFLSFDIEKKINICMNHCDKRVMKEPEVVYVNERHKYKIQKQQKDDKISRLAKYPTLLLLSYHFLNPDSNGFIKYTSEKELAKRLNCSLRTIRNSNERLVSFGCISISRHTSDLISVHITDYDTYHLSKEEGGTGYVQMTKTFFEELAKLGNVNAIRLALRGLMKFEEDVIVKKKDEAFYTYRDIKAFMPAHINHKKIIDELLAKSAHMFDIKSSTDCMKLSVKDAFNGKVQKLEKEKEFGAILSDYIAEQNETVTVKEIEDLIDLSMEYGVESVKEGFDEAIQYNNTVAPIENLGGFVRVAIRNKIYAHVLGDWYLLSYSENTSEKMVA